MRDNQFNTVTRQCTLEHSTDSIGNIFKRAFNLFKNNYTWANPLRSIGIRTTNLDNTVQLSLFDDDGYDNNVDMDNRIKLLTARFGKLEVEPVGALGGW